MDRIIQGLLKAFREEQSFNEDMSETQLFEYFVNYCLVSKEYESSFDIQEVSIGGCSDLAIDGIAILVNGDLVESTEEIEDLIKRNKSLTVKFILIQAKTSNNFDSGDIAKFLIGVRAFFDEKSTLLKNEQLNNKFQIMKFLYDNSIYFKSNRPTCIMYYVTTGKWRDDENLKGTINLLKKDIEAQEIFDTINFIPVDANGLRQIHNLINNKISKKIKFEKRISIPEVEAQQAYIGVLPAKEYLKLITDEETSNILKGIFYDNIRDFEQDNDVNIEIENTINNGNQKCFCLYNNGITIIAESVVFIQDTVTISDYQIVNGCQTSHVLYNNRNEIKDELYIPIKLICLDPENNIIKNDIIKGNNRQTPITQDQLSALTDFQKNLEKYYESMIEHKKLYYERRSKQFNGISSIEKIRIVSISNQIQCFSAMFLGKAHKIRYYNSSLREDVINKIFLSEHDPIGYYVSAYAKFRLDSLLRKKQIENKYRPFQYHMLNIFRIQISGENMPDIKSKKFINYCQNMENVLEDDTKCKEAFLKTTTIIDEIICTNYNKEYNRAYAKTVGFSEEIEKILTNGRYGKNTSL